MTFKKLLTPLLIATSVLSAGALTISAFSLGWFKGPTTKIEDEIIDGEVGLRGYFYDGDGLTPETAYEIVSPIHFYNLTRLQNLGIFSEPRYFQIGHDFGEPYGLKCLAEDGETKINYLDMENLCTEVDVLPIGGEGAPFIGVFNGNGLTVKNLTVKGNPEDIGVFGYVSYEGSVTGLVCQDLEIVSLGYNNNSSSKEYQLFNADIDDIFDENVSDISKLMSLTFYDGLGLSKTPYALKHPNGLSGTVLTNVNNSDHLLGGGSTVYKGYFEPTFPQRDGEIFTYSWKSSSPLVKEGEIDTDGDGDLEKAIIIDLKPLQDSVGSETSFNSGGDMEADVRLSLIASVEVEGYVFSRVIQSYKIEFYSNGYTWEDQKYGAALFCDYVDSGLPNDRNTNYHHGNNIGLLAGHVDGTMTNSYVYNGTLTFNETGYHQILSESETGLIGEIGSNVLSTLDPELSLVTNGDIGVMNFSKIYSMIRSDMNADQTYNVACGRAMSDDQTAKHNYISYNPFRNNESFSEFSEYLRRDVNNNYIIETSTDMSPYSPTYTISRSSDIKSDFNKVDFLWNKVIEDTEDHDRGMGVFKVVSSKNTSADEEHLANYFLSNIGSCQIINGSPKTEVYFSTAELDHLKDGDTYWNDNPPLRAYKIPTYSDFDGSYIAPDINSFNHPFSRDYNYVFKMNLADMALSGGKFYLWNTNSVFLQNYLTSVLIDKFGAPITPENSSKFGFMFRSSENELLTSLSSYMPVSTPKGDKKLNHNAKYYPSDSIVFRIENEAGANVSVVGNGEDITIYSNDTTKSSGGVTALYSMRSTNVSSGTDEHRYFEYDVGSGATTTETTVNTNMSSDNGALYGHIFKLPQGDYVIGSRSGTAKIYFLSVQGQNNASLGAKEMTFIGSEVENVDFITEAPSELNEFPFVSTTAQLSLKANFNLVSGSMTMNAINYNAKNYINIYFDDEPRFVTYLFAYSKHPDKTFFVRNNKNPINPWAYPRV